ncbi:RNA dependent RNA polymerase [Potato cyst nematode rhabdovirus]|nr:RNA dependent RNA polymerase [Potato cyst nematode rhabdovirus]DAZ92285.1 TPA_asm: RNA-dependent RNA polymerase [Potato cyst nematode rhabdovirus]
MQFSNLGSMEEEEFGVKQTKAPRRKVFDLRLRNPMRSEMTEYVTTGRASVLGMKKEIAKNLSVARSDYLSFTSANNNLLKKEFHRVLGRMLSSIDRDFQIEWGMTKCSTPRMDTEGAWEDLQLNRRVMGLAPQSVIEINASQRTALESKFIWMTKTEDYASYCVSLCEGSGDYKPRYGEKHGHVWKWTGPRGIQLLASGRFFSLVSDQTFCVLWADEIRLLFELSYVRYVVELSCIFGHKLYEDAYPPTHVMKQFFVLGDAVLMSQGNEAYKALKFIEPICIGELIKDDDFDFMFDDRLFFDTVRVDCDEQNSQFSSDFSSFVTSLNHKPHWISQIFGLFRAFGHPYVDVIKGVEKVKAVSRSTKIVDLKLVSDVTACGIEEFCTNYRRRNGRWPQLTAPRLDREVFNAYRESRPINVNSSKYFRLDWLQVRASQNFMATEHVSSVDLIEDKSCSASRFEIQESLEKSGDLPPAMKRKTILRYLERETYDILDELKKIDDEGLSKDKLVIGVTPKERELKNEPRLFSLMTYEFRMYIAATEKLLSECIVPYYPDITMTYSLSELRQKMHGIGAKMSEGHQDEVHVVLNLDFEKWNLNFRHEVVARLFEFYDNLLGFRNLIRRTHLFFSQSTFYIADRFHRLVPSDFDGRPGQHTWDLHWGGMEGLRQKGWTLLTSSVLRYVSSQLGVRLEVMGQGDNQVIVAHIPIDRRYLDGEVPQNIQDSVKSLYNKLKDHLYKTFASLGLPIKREETWTSTKLFAYGKVLIYRGVQLSMSLKRASRMFFENNEFIPTFFNAISSVGTSAEAMAEYDVGGDVSYLLMWCEISRSLNYYRYYHPLSGVSLGQRIGRQSDKVSKTKFRGIRKTLTTILQSPRLLTTAMVFSNVYVGGYPVPSYYDLCVKGFPDKLFLICAIYLKAMPMIVTENPELRKMMSSVMMFEFSEEQQYERLFEDPYTMNLDKPAGATELVRDVTKDFLKTEWVRNKEVKKLLAIEDAMTAPLIEILTTMVPCLPRLGSIIMDNTPMGLCRKALSRFEKPDTIQRFARQHNAWSMSNVEHDVADADTALFLYFLHSISRENCPVVTTFNLYENIRLIRQKSWRLPLEGVTVPPPFWIFEAHDAFYKCDPETLTARIHVRATSTNMSVIMNEYGNQSGYQGSRTKQKDSTHSRYTIESRSAPIKAAKILSSHKGWLYTDEEAGLGKLINDLISSLTDIPLEYFVSDVVAIESSTGHRMQDTRSHHHGYPGIIGTIFSHFAATTNGMAEYSKGSQNHPIHFQQSICYCQHFTYEFVRTAKTRGDLHHLADECNLHFHLRKAEEVPALNDNTVIIDYPTADKFVFDPIRTHVTFTSAEDVKVKVRIEAKHADVAIDPETTTPEFKNAIFSTIVAQECLRSIVRRMEYANASSVAKDTFPFVWYNGANGGHVIAQLLKGFIGYALTHIGKNLCLKIQGDPKEIVEDYIIRFWAVTDPSMLSCLATFFSNPSFRQRLYASQVKVSFPRAVPASRSSLMDSVHKTMINELVQLFMDNGAGGHGLFAFETTGDSLGPQAIINNFNFFWYVACCVDRNIVPDIGVLRTFARCVGETFRDFSYGAETSTRATLTALCLSKMHLRIGAQDLEVYARMAERAFTIGHYKCSLESLSMHAGELPHFVYPSNVFLSTPKRSSATYRVRIKPMSDYSHIHTDKCKFPEHVLPNRHFLRPLRLETGAVYKWFSILSGMLDLNLTASASLGDGSGGVCALIGKMWPATTLYFNTLYTIKGRAATDFTDFYPQALEHAQISPDRVKGLNMLVDGISDITSSLWPDYFLSNVGHTLDLITCDAEGSGWGEDDKGLKIIENIIRVAEIVGPTACIIMKHYLYGIDALNNALKLITSCGGRYNLVCSKYTSKSSSEVFIVANPIDQWKYNDSKVCEWNGVNCVDALLAIMVRDKITPEDIEKGNTDQDQIIEIYNLQNEIPLAQYALITLGIPMNFIRRRDVVGILKHTMLLPHRLYGVKYLQNIRDPRDVVFPFTKIGDELLGFLVLYLTLILHHVDGLNKDLHELGIISVCAMKVAQRWIMVPFADNELKEKLYTRATSGSTRELYVWALPKRYFCSRDSRELFRKMGAYNPFKSGLMRGKIGLDISTDKAPNIYVKYRRSDKKGPDPGTGVTLCIRWPKCDELLYNELMRGFEQLIEKIKAL